MLLFFNTGYYVLNTTQIAGILTEKHTYSLGLFPKIDRSEQKIICLEWSNMPFKHDIVLSLTKFKTLDPHPPIV